MREFYQRLVTGIILALCALAVFSLCPPLVISLYLTFALLYILAIEWPRFNQWKLTLLYPLLPFLILIGINQYGARWELPWLCVLVISHDTGAYIAGRLWGKHKLCPTISPGKTWEGLCGGMALSLAIAAIMSYTITELRVMFTTAFLTFVSIVLLINCAAVLGDLFESWLKRLAHLKDSGSILPGHGGILDRVDSLLFAAMAWAMIRLLY